MAALAALALIFLGLPAAYVMVDGLNDRLEPADVAVVLGNKVELDGRPSARLAARLDRALEVYRAGLVAKVIVSGGTGVEGHDEARVMAAYLIARGVPAADVLADSGGWDTWLTARNAAALMKKHGWRRAFAVSQHFHLTRTKLALRRFGVEVTGWAHARIWEWRDPYSIVREAVSVWDYALLKGS